MKRTVLDHTPDGLKRRLTGLERQVADLQRIRNPPASYVEVDVSPGSTFYVRRSSAFVVPDSTVTQVEWDGGAFTAGADQFASWAAGTPGEVEILQDGLYWLSTALSFGSSTVGARYVEVGVNGSSDLGFNNAAAFGPIQGWGGGVSFGAGHVSTSIALPLVAGDFVAVYVEQTSGGDLGMGDSPIPQLSITRFAGQITTF